MMSTARHKEAPLKLPAKLKKYRRTKAQLALGDAEYLRLQEVYKMAVEEHKKHPDWTSAYIGELLELRASAVRAHWNKPDEIIQKHGHPTALTRDFEDFIEYYLKLRARTFYHVARDEFKAEVRRVTNCTVQASDTWINGFFRRHPSLSWRRPQNTEIARMVSANPIVFRKHYAAVTDIMQEFGIVSPGQIFNADETCLMFNTTDRRVIAITGQRAVALAVPGFRDSTSMMATICADTDVRIGPFFIIKGKDRRLANMSKGLQPGCMAVCSDGGSETTATFEHYLHHLRDNCRVPEDKWILLIMDGHATHNGIQPLSEGFKLKICILTLPPHTTHVTQPLDVSIFRSLKVTIRHLMCEWNLVHRGINFGASDVVDLAIQAWTIAATESNIASGFRTTGLWPRSVDWITKWESEHTFDTALAQAAAASSSNNPDAPGLGTLNYINKLAEKFPVFPLPPAVVSTKKPRKKPPVTPHGNITGKLQLDIDTYLRETEADHALLFERISRLFLHLPFQEPLTLERMQRFCENNGLSTEGTLAQLQERLAEKVFKLAHPKEKSLRETLFEQYQFDEGVCEAEVEARKRLAKMSETDFMEIHLEDVVKEIKKKKKTSTAGTQLDPLDDEEDVSKRPTKKKRTNRGKALTTNSENEPNKERKRPRQAGLLL